MVRTLRVKTISGIGPFNVGVCAKGTNVLTETIAVTELSVNKCVYEGTIATAGGVTAGEFDLFLDSGNVGHDEASIGPTDGLTYPAASCGADNIYQAKATWFDDDSALVPTDRYEIVWFKNGQPITSGITLPLIQVFKAADGVDLIASTAMTQIASTGTYKYDATGVLRLVDGVAYMAKFSATIDGVVRTWYLPVGRDS